MQKDEFWFKELSGVELSADVVIIPKMRVHKFSGDVLFTHRGISGPAILNATFWAKGSNLHKFCLNLVRKNLVNGRSLVQFSLQEICAEFL